MFSLSTAWNSARHDSGAAMVSEILSIGLDTIELNFSLSREMVDDIIALVRNTNLHVSSVHNICPLPDEIERGRASPDYYSLASLDDRERERAVEVTKNTILCARRLNAQAVVLHAGRIDMKDRTRELASCVNDESRCNDFRQAMIMARASRSRDYLDMAIKSLGELVPYSLDLGIALCIENRYYYREIPVFEEFGELFSRFKEGELFYWHDVGHAEVFERLGLVRHKDLLDKYAGRLKGIHLHDIIGCMDDHKAPGYGTFDFAMLKPYVRQDTLKVIEAHHPATAEEIKHSLEYLAKVFG